jgi:hypothetical protein
MNRDQAQSPATQPQLPAMERDIASRPSSERDPACCGAASPFYLSHRSDVSPAISPDSASPTPTSTSPDSTISADADTTHQPIDPSHTSHSSHTSHPTEPPPTTAPNPLTPATIESQDNFELLFDPAIPFEIHTKKRSPLDRLAPEHQQALIGLIREHSLQSVANLLARPLPYGLNLQTTPTALSRFTHRYITAQEKREREQKILTAQQMMSESGNPTAVFNQLSSKLLQMRILATTSESQPDLKELHTLVNCLTKLRRQSLAERKQSHP